jgi:hypothetical protein
MHQKGGRGLPGAAGTDRPLDEGLIGRAAEREQGGAANLPGQIGKDSFRPAIQWIAGAIAELGSTADFRPKAGFARAQQKECFQIVGQMVFCTGMEPAQNFKVNPGGQARNFCVTRVFHEAGGA